MLHAMSTTQVLLNLTLQFAAKLEYFHYYAAPISTIT